MPQRVEGSRVTASETAIATRERPRLLADVASQLTAVAVRVARWRWIVVPTLALAIAPIRITNPPADMVSFGQLGRAIVSGHIGSAYATDANQGGPFQLLAAAPYPEHLLLSVGFLRVLFAVWGIALGVAAMWLVAGVRRYEGLPPSAFHELGAGLATAIWLVGGDLFAGHLAELAIPVAWVVAGIAGRRDRPVVAGLLLGASAGFEPWGLLGIPIVLLVPRVRRIALSALVCVLAAGACYLPFVVTGHFALFEHQWPIVPGTLVHLIWPHAATFGWLPRVAQAALSVAFGAVVGLAARRSPYAVWLVPLVIVLVRLTFDPTDFAYYWVAAQVVLLAGVATIDTHKRLALALYVAAAWCVSTSWGPWRLADTLTALVLACVITVNEHRSRLSGPTHLPAAGGEPVVDRDVGDVDADHRLAEPA
jgi:hypothetical protein